MGALGGVSSSCILLARFELSKQGTYAARVICELSSKWQGQEKETENNPHPGQEKRDGWGTDRGEWRKKRKECSGWS